MPISVLSESDFKTRTFDAAKRAFAKKVPLTSEEFDRIAVKQRKHAFRIATVNNARLVQWARDLLKRAIEEGTSFRDFRNALLKEFGGQQMPALHRLRLAFRQNMLSAFSDSRRASLDEPEAVKAFPFRRYLTVGNGIPGVRNVRPEHARLHGLVFAWDDPFWDRHTPPWGYGCRCMIVPILAGEVKTRRIKIRNLGHVRKRLRIRPEPGFGKGLGDVFDLSALDADLRAIVEGRIND